MISFTVQGDPVPQGSMYSPKGSTAVLHSKRKSRTGRRPRTVKQWRDEAKLEARAKMGRLPKIDGAVRVDVWFYLERPKSRQDAIYPDRKPDLDKLERALGDSLEGTVLTEDSRIVDWHAAKRYADTGHPLGRPCAVVTVTLMGTFPPEGCGGPFTWDGMG